MRRPHAVPDPACALQVSVGSAVFYSPKDKKVIADNARKNFYRGGAGDHVALMTVFNEWAESQFSLQWCMENFVQARSPVPVCRALHSESDTLAVWHSVMASKLRKRTLRGAPVEGRYLVCF